MTKLVLEPPEGYMDDPFTWTVRRRLSRDENTMILFLGRPRRGKSSGAMSTGEQLDAHHDFDASHVTFLPQDYIRMLDRAKKGEFIVFDEPGAEWSSRRFMSMANILLSSVTITFGSKLINTAWAVPIMKQTDVNMSRMANYTFRMLQHPYPKGIAKFYYNSTSEITGKVYTPSKGYCYFAMPFQNRPEELRKYEQAKKQYQDQRYDEYWQSFAEKNKGLLPKKPKLGAKELQEIADQVVGKMYKYSLTDKKGEEKLNVNLIRTAHDISGADARAVIDLAMKKREQLGR